MSSPDPRLQARVAPRPGSHAIELGMALYRRHLLPLWGLSLLTLMPVAVIASVLLPTTLVVLLLWWLQPLVERPLLLWCGEALFNPQPRLRQVLLRLGQRSSWRGLFWQLTFGRLSPWRTLNTPVWLLENQTRASASARQRLMLHGTDQAPVARVAFACLLLFLLLSQGFTVLFNALLSPDWWSQLVDSFGQEATPLSRQIEIASTVLALMLVAPLHVCSGFMLYINRRTWLEGWDLQPGLQRIAQRRQHYWQGAVVPLLCTLALGLGGLSPDLQAASSGDVPPSAAREQALELSSAPEWSGLRSQRHLTDFDWTDLLQDSEPRDPLLDPHRLESLFKVLRWVLFILLGLLIAFAILRLVRYQRRHPLRWRRHRIGRTRQTAWQAPQMPQETLEQAHAAEDPRRLLAALYREVLARFPDAGLPAVRPGDTEVQILRRLSGASRQPAFRHFTQGVTEAWLKTAWAGSTLPLEQVHELVQRWRQGLLQDESPEGESP